MLSLMKLNSDFMGCKTKTIILKVTKMLYRAETKSKVKVMRILGALVSLKDRLSCTKRNTPKQ